MLPFANLQLAFDLAGEPFHFAYCLRVSIGHAPLRLLFAVQKLLYRKAG